MGLMQKRTLKIEFTDILYGVVISNAISKLTLRFTMEDFMRLFALFIIFDDWIDYHITTSLVEQSPNKYLVGYVFDILILITWYYVTITPSSQIGLYVFFIILFFFFSGVWDTIMLNNYRIKEFGIQLC